MAGKNDKLIYPPGVRDITEEVSTDDLVRRLKDCAHAFQNISQEEDNSAYVPLALHLASETFLEHPSQDVRLLVACCIADIFRVYAPDAPYKDLNQLKVIFEFFVDQLRGLEDTTKPSFKRHFYLLENLSCVKTFNICVELEDNQKIIVRLFKLMFKVFNDSHSAKVKKFILDMLSPLISEADTVSQELLDVILKQIIEPVKSQNKNACLLAQEILKRNVSSLEPYIQAFFNNALILGTTLQSDVAKNVYELLYELNVICPTMLIVVLPQLEFKLKSNEEKERLDVTKVLARMFSDESSSMIGDNRTLWSCFLARFNDISPQVRIRCIQSCKNFLLYHRESRDDITEQLRKRHRDLDENVRYEVVLAILSTAKEDFSAVNDELLSFVKERTLDKKFKIRKESLLGLAMLYKQHLKKSETHPAELESLAWIRNKVLHAYYQPALDDRILVERALHTCIVPYQKPMHERMKLLYQLFCSVDDYAVKAFKEIMRCQSQLRAQVKSILEIIQCEKSDNRQQAIASKVLVLSKCLLDPVKSNEYILKFCNDLESNLRLRTMMTQMLTGSISCSEAESKVKDILKTLGHPVQTNHYYVIIKQLFERIAPVMVDKSGICHLIDCVKDSLLGNCSIEAELGLVNSALRGLELLWVLTCVYTTTFQDESIFRDLMQFLSVEDEACADMTLQIFMNISSEMELNFPDVSMTLLPILETFAETGTSKQAKHAIYCINSIVIDKEKVFGRIIENLKKHFTLESQYFRTALVSVGHIAFLCHDMFAADFKTIVAKIVVKDLLMLDQDLPRGGDEIWGPLDSLPDETKVKIEGMKVMVRWLSGLKDMIQPALSTLRLLTTVILHDGDLMERQHTAPIENSWMRLSAASCMLKLCQEPNYANVITLDQFQVLAQVINDKCDEVKERFAQKVHKGLCLMKLPLMFLAVFTLGALDERKEFRAKIKSFIVGNINKRKDFLKQKILTEDKLRSVLPDYALPYAVHLLAHSPLLKSYNDVAALKKIKECLWMLMEPLMIKNENYSFAFLKRLLENIKQTKDKQAPEDEAANLKLYAVCDLALSIVMSKTNNFVLKDYPVYPALPSKLFTDPDLSYSNMKTYLPPELICDNPLKSGFEIDIFEGNKADDKVADEVDSAINNSSLDFPDIDASISNVSSKLSETSSFAGRKTRSKAKDSNVPASLLLEQSTEEEESEINPMPDISLKPKENPPHKKTAVSTKEPPKPTRGRPRNSKNVQNTSKKLADNPPEVSRLSSHQKTQEISSQNKDKQINTVKDKSKSVKNSNFPARRSIRTSVTSDKSSCSSQSLSSSRLNGVLTDSDVSSLCGPDVQNALKRCNIPLRKDEVEKYIALSSSVVDSSEEKDLSDEDFSDSVPKNSKKISSATISKKRKRDESPTNSSVKTKSLKPAPSKKAPAPAKEKAAVNSKSNPIISKSRAVKSKQTASPNKTPKNSPVKKTSKVSMVNGSRDTKMSLKESSPRKPTKASKPTFKKSQRNQVKKSLKKR